MRQGGVKPELECFDLGHVANAEPLVEMGALQRPLQYSFVLGVLGGAPPAAETLAAMARSIERRDTWEVIGIGRAQWKLVGAALALGETCGWGWRTTSTWTPRAPRWPGERAAGGEGGADGPRRGPRADEPGPGAGGAVDPGRVRRGSSSGSRRRSGVAVGRPLGKPRWPAEQAGSVRATSAAGAQQPGSGLFFRGDRPGAGPASEPAAGGDPGNGSPSGSRIETRRGPRP